jgi:TolB-like protein
VGWVTPNTGSPAERLLAVRPLILHSLEKPSIAVLPFDNLGGDPQQYFAAGLTEDILTALARFNQLTVIARNFSFVYKGQAVQAVRIAEAGRDLNVRYVVEGNARRSRWMRPHWIGTNPTGCQSGKHPLQVQVRVPTRMS